MKQENHPIDDLIRQRITDLPPGPTRGWSDLERRLEGTDPTDQTVADKLNTLAPTAAAGSWAALAVKLDATDADGAAAVDTAVATGLNQASPHVPTGWARLAARLELIGQRREMVVCLKISEAALLLSLLLLTFRFGDEGTDRTPLAESGAEQAFPLALTRSAAETVSAIPSRPIVPAAREVTSTSVVEALPNPTNFSLTSPTPDLPTVQLGSKSVAVVETLGYGVEDTHRRLFAPLRGPILLSGDPVQYYLNVFVSPVDLNQVVTLENPSFGIQAQSKLSTGYSVGALVDMTQGKNALQFGLVYGYRSYVPAEILNIQQDTTLTPPDEDIRYGRLTYRSVSLPLNYQRELVSNDRWRFAAGIGAAMNIILNSEFQLADGYTTEDLARNIDNFIIANRSSYDGRSSSSRRNILNPEVGYLQGGSIFDNTSLYLSGNIRVERLISDRWSLYFSPTVTRLLTVRSTDGGKGPLEDRIHNTMLRFGTRIRLTDK